MSTAEDLYEMTKQLPATERLWLVEKLAHGLVPEPEPTVRAASAAGIPARVQLVGQVTDLAIEPPHFTVRTPRGAVAVTGPAQ